MKTLCIEGWRGVNHSIAMVNQHQILALLEHPDVQLFHKDMPFFLPHWSPAQLPAGFSPEDTARIASLTAPAETQSLDCVFRIVTPTRTTFVPKQKTLSFVVTEFGPNERTFETPLFDKQNLTRDENRIVTPSHWARTRLVDYGFDPERILVIPHGFDPKTFTPLPPDERARLRNSMGVTDEQTLFLNVGVATWNKGLDLLITAFAAVRRNHPGARLVLKDHPSLYGLSVEKIIGQVRKTHSNLMTANVLESISVLSQNMNQTQLRALYSVADAYVSPYRAEGFNMPVLEAMACGTPVLVTDGGATDDFCHQGLATRIRARPRKPEENPDIQGHFLVPDLAHLIELMTRCMTQKDERSAKDKERHLLDLKTSHSWKAVATRFLSNI